MADHGSQLTIGEVRGDWACRRARQEFARSVVLARLEDDEIVAVHEVDQPVLLVDPP